MGILSKQALYQW